MNDHSWIAIISAVFAGLTSLLTLFFTLWQKTKAADMDNAAREHRNRMELLAAQAATNATIAAVKAEELKSTLISSKVSREKQISELGDTLKAAIGENSDMNKQALSAANNVNAKIQSLGIEMAGRSEIDLGAKTVHIDAANVEINTPPPKNH